MKIRIIDRPWMTSYRYLVEYRSWLGIWHGVDSYKDLELAKVHAQALAVPPVVWP